MLEKSNLRYPPTEDAWLKYRANRLEQYKCSIESILAGMGFPREGYAGDRWLGLAVGVAFNSGPSHSAAEGWSRCYTDFKGEDYRNLILMMGAAAEAIGMRLYSMEKRIYRPDSLLVETFMGMEIPQGFPMQIFRDLPQEGLALELPSRSVVGQFICRNYLVVPFDVSSEAINDGPRSLAILGYFGKNLGYKPITVLDLRGEFVLGPTASYSVSAGAGEDSGLFLNSEAMRLALNGEGKAMAANLHKPTVQMVHFLLNLVLYLKGEDDQTTLVRAARKNLSGKTEVEAKKLRDLQAPHVYGFGAKWGRAVQHWIAESSRLTPTPGCTGRSVTPHIRKAHPHLYWTGPGRTTPVVKFLMPVLVKGGSAAESNAEELPTIHAVH